MCVSLDLLFGLTEEEGLWAAVLPCFFKRGLFEFSYLLRTDILSSRISSIRAWSRFLFVVLSYFRVSLSFLGEMAGSLILMNWMSEFVRTRVTWVSLYCFRFFLMNLLGEELLNMSFEISAIGLLYRVLGSREPLTDGKFDIHYFFPAFAWLVYLLPYGMCSLLSNTEPLLL